MPPAVLGALSESEFYDSDEGAGVQDPRLLDCDLALPDGVFAPLTGMTSLCVRVRGGRGRHEWEVARVPHN